MNFISKKRLPKKKRGKSGSERRIAIDGVEDGAKKAGKTRETLNLRLPAATNKTLLKRKGSNESIAWSHTTKATKRVEHLINRNSTEGDSQTIFEGTPGRRT